MEGWSTLGRLVMLLGIVLVILGALLAWGPRVHWLGRLPGDFVFGGEGWKVYLPLGTSVLLSAVLTLVLWLVRALSRK
jgi:hypothetical protein